MAKTITGVDYEGGKVVGVTISGIIDADNDQPTSAYFQRVRHGRWLKARKAKRAAMTNRAIQINISRLAEYAAKSGMTVEAYLEEVLARGWASFYPINNYLRQNAKQVGTNGIAISNECKSELDGLF